MTAANRLQAALLAHFDEGYDELRGLLIPALKAVIELHQPQDTYISGGPTGRPLCFGCDFDGYDGEHPEWPCRTIQTVAHVLGVETTR